VGEGKCVRPGREGTREGAKGKKKNQIKIEKNLNFITGGLSRTSGLRREIKENGGAVLGVTQRGKLFYGVTRNGGGRRGGGEMEKGAGGLKGG